MYWAPVVAGLTGLACVSGAQAKERAIGDVLAGAPIDGVMVAADNVVQCGQATVTWAGTTGPVSLLVGTGGFYANLQPIQTIDDISGSSTSVTINQKEGTDMIFKITDSQNKVGYVQNIKVGSGDDSCLDDSSSPSSSSSAEASSSAAAPVVVETSSTAENSPSPSSSSNGDGNGRNGNGNGNTKAGSSQVQPTQSPSASSAAAASTSVVSSASAAAVSSVSSVSAAAASASAVTSAQSSAAPSASSSSSSSSGGPDSVAAASNTTPNGALGMTVPGVGALLMGVGIAAIF